MSCRHARTTDSRAYPYTGSVAVAPYTDENRAAHGNVMFRETCFTCGAERRVNVNGSHAEYSPWGETRDERDRRAQRARAELADRVRQARDKAHTMLRAVPDLPLTGPGERAALARLDAEGYICTEGATWDELAHAVLGTEWFARAQAARRAVLGVADLEAQLARGPGNRD